MTTENELTPPWKDRPWNWSDRWILPEPKCELGYTEEQVKRIVKDYEDFTRWIRGQTGGLCGAEYTGCDEAHGGTVYKHDLERYLS